MTTTLVDSSVWIDLLRGNLTPEVGYLRELAASTRLGIPDVVIQEVLQGVRTDIEAGRVLRDLRKYAVHNLCGEALAVKAAANYRRLRAQGRTVRSTIDALIATYCIENGYGLLHADRDYDAFEQLGLRVTRADE